MKTSQFVEEGTPYEWFDCATDLWFGAQSLWENDKNVKPLTISIANKVNSNLIPIITRPYFLLVALSFENLLKGIIISENPDFLNDGKLNRILQTHNLSKLAKMTDLITFNTEDLKLLDLATNVILSTGRYPISKNSDSEHERLDLTSTKRIDLTALYNNISNCLMSQINKGWSGPESVRMPPIYSPREDSAFGDLTFNEIIGKSSKLILKPFIKIEKI